MLIIDTADALASGQPLQTSMALLLSTAAGDAAVVSRLKELVVTSGSAWAFVPLKPNPSFEAWTGEAAYASSCI
jgi:hypothetical protein